MCTPFSVTVNEPNSHSVGSGPIEKIMRSIIDATSVRMPEVRGTVNTIIIDMKIIAQISNDRWVFNSERDTKSNK